MTVKNLKESRNLHVVKIANINTIKYVIPLVVHFINGISFVIFGAGRIPDHFEGN